MLFVAAVETHSRPNIKAENELGNKRPPELQEIRSKLFQNFHEKDKTIETLEQKVAFLETSGNRIERYTSKDAIIIQNLPETT